MRDLEYATMRPLANQRIAVGQTLGAADVVAVEVHIRRSRVLPGDFPGSTGLCL